MRVTGYYERLGTITYFIPYNLPPHDPPLEINAHMASLYGEVMLSLGKLNEMAQHIPDRERFIKAYVIKEALLSSSIEGIHTTLFDVVTQPLFTTKPSKETQLVMNYTRALEKALELMQVYNLPVSSRVILQAHKALMATSVTGNGASDPGNYRKQSVRVGNLVPPPPHYIQELMYQLEQYTHADSQLPAVIRAGLVHVQFETIHPFLDGNGRIGRLLIVLLLIENNILSEPLLYPSYYFKKNQLDYYRHLDRVRTHGDFEGWIMFYLTGLKESSIDAYTRAKAIESLRQELIQRIIQHQQTGIFTYEQKCAVLSFLFSYPVTTLSELAKHCAVSFTQAQALLDDFVALGIVQKEETLIPEQMFVFKRYLDLLEQEMLS